MNKLRLIKLTVCLLTFLLICGMFGSIGIVIKQLKKNPEISNISLNQPSGSYIADYSVIKNKVYVFIKGGGLSDRLAIVDSTNKEPVFIKINEEF